MRGSRRRLDFDLLMRHLALVGFGALAAWAVVGGFGTVAGYLTIDPRASLRFMIAVMILVFSRHLYHRFHEWHYRRVPPDDRFGFAHLAREHQVEADVHDGAATGS